MKLWAEQKFAWESLIPWCASTS